jgi:hypothetical protein
MTSTDKYSFGTPAVMPLSPVFSNSSKTDI